MSSPTSSLQPFRTTPLARPHPFETQPRSGQTPPPLPYVFSHQLIAASCLSFCVSRSLFSMRCSLFYQKQWGGYTLLHRTPIIRSKDKEMTTDSLSSDFT